MSVTVPAEAPIPDTYAATSPFGSLLIQAMQPWITRDLAVFLDAIGAMCDPLYGLVSDSGSDGDADYLPGYGQLFNVNPSPGQAGADALTCPTADLGYVGQFVGVQIPAGADDVTARSLVMAESGFSRATDAAVIAAAKRTLTGTQSVTLIRRRYVDGTANAGWFGVVVRPEEVTTVAALQAAVNAVKLGGLMWWLQQSDGTSWNAEASTWSADTLTWDQKA